MSHRHQHLYLAIALAASIGLSPVAGFCQAPYSPNIQQPNLWGTPASQLLTPNDITQPAQPPQWQGAAGLKGRLQTSENLSWYQQSELKGTVYRPYDKATRSSIQFAHQFKLDAAETRLKKLLAKNPNNAGAHHGLALVTYYRTASSDATYRNQQSELLADAIQHAMAALRLQPNYVDAHLTLSKLYAERLYRLPDAQEFAAHAYGLAPNNSNVLTQVGKLLLDESDPIDVGEAVKLLEKATAANRRNAAAYTQLGRAYATQGEFHPALNALNTAVWLQPNSAPTHHFRATIYAAQGNQTAAVASYQTALLNDPEYLPAHLDLASLYQQRQNWPEAITTLQNAYHSLLRADHPQRHAIALQLSQAALANQQAELASATAQILLDDPTVPPELFQQAQRIVADAQTFEATQDLALASGYGGDLMTTASAHHSLATALKAQPGHTQAKLVDTKLYGHARAIDEWPASEQTNLLNTTPLTANQALDQGEVFQARFDPLRANMAYQLAARSADSPDNAVRIGDSLMTLGQPEAARLAFERAVRGEFSQTNPIAAQAAQAGLRQLSKNDAMIAEQWASLSTFSKTDPRYKSTLNNILQTNANHPEAHLALAKLYEHNHQWAQAIRHYHWVITVAPTHQRALYATKRLAALSKKLSTVAKKVKHLNTDS